MDLGLEFDCQFVRTTWRSDDAGVGVCDIISFRLHPCGGSYAYTFVMAANRFACWIDFWERYLYLVNSSANSCLPMAGKKFACWNCSVGRRGGNVDNDANLAEI